MTPMSRKKGKQKMTSMSRTNEEEDKKKGGAKRRRQKRKKTRQDHRTEQNRTVHGRSEQTREACHSIGEKEEEQRKAEKE